MGVIESKLQRNSAFDMRVEHWRGTVEALQEQESELRLGGGTARLEKQRSRGKMTARERVAALCDPESSFLELGIWAASDMYEEYGGAPAAGVVTGIREVSSSGM